MMRALAVIAHYATPRALEGGAYGSQSDVLPRIAALAQTVSSLHRSFGTRDHAHHPDRPSDGYRAQNRSLKIVVLQVGDCGVVDRLGLAPGTVEVERCDVEPMMLPFEAQRVMRDRMGDYDYYLYLEDDIAIFDPYFLDKAGWFAATFGNNKILVPLRYELSTTRTSARVAIGPKISTQLRDVFRRPGQAKRLSGQWHDQAIHFELADNPHAGAFVVTDAQLRQWVLHPTFYDRVANWVGPLESAANLSLGLTFDLYRAHDPDPWFLAVEHFGTQFARTWDQKDGPFGDHVLLEIAYAALDKAAKAGADQELGVFSGTYRSLNAAAIRQIKAERDLAALQNSRSGLLKALCKSFMRKMSRPAKR